MPHSVKSNHDNLRSSPTDMTVDELFRLAGVVIYLIPCSYPLDAEAMLYYSYPLPGGMHHESC